MFRSGSSAEKAHESAEMLGLMVHDPNLTPEELSQNSNPDFIRIPKLVIAGGQGHDKG